MAKHYDFLKDIKIDDLRILQSGLESKLLALFRLHFDKRIREMALGLLKEAPESTNINRQNFNKGMAQGFTEVKEFFDAIADEYKKRTQPVGNAH